MGLFRAIYSLYTRLALHWRSMGYRLNLFPARRCRNHTFVGGFSAYLRGFQTRSCHHVKTWRHFENNNFIPHRIPSTYCNSIVVNFHDIWMFLKCITADNLFKFSCQPCEYIKPIYELCPRPRIFRLQRDKRSMVSF